MSRTTRTAVLTALALAGALGLAQQASAYVYWGFMQGGNWSIGRGQLSGAGRAPLLTAPGVAWGMDVRGRQLYWAGGGAIGRVNVDGSGLAGSFVASGGLAMDVAVDDEHVYWAESNGGRIGRANLDGSGANPSFLVVGGNPASVAVDDEHLYWTDSGTDTIGRARRDGSSPNTAFISGTSGVSGVTVDDGHVYWTNATSNAIGRANLDGTGVNQSFVTGTATPHGIDVDATHIWWVNKAMNTVARARLDGTGVTQGLFYVGGDGGGIGVAVDPLPLRPALSLAAAPGEAVELGGTVRATATLSGGDAPTGTVTFRLYGRTDPGCGQTPIATETVPVTGAGDHVAADVTPPRPGTYRWTASYSGDVANAPAQTGCGDAGAAVVVTKRSWALALAPSADPALGRPLHAVATLEPPAGAGALPTSPAAAGAPPLRAQAQGWGDEGIHFRLYGPDDPTCAGRPVLSEIVSLGATPGVPVRSPDYVPQQLGVHRWAVSLSEIDDQAEPVGCAAGVESVVGLPSGTPPPGGRPPAGPPHVDPRPVALPADPPPPVDPPAVDPPAVDPPPAAVPSPVEAFALAARCVRPPSPGARVRVTLRLRAQPGPLHVRVERALGTRGRDRCPAAGGGGRFAGGLSTVVTLPEISSARRIPLDLALEPALYRITVRARAADGRLSTPKRRFLRVLAPRSAISRGLVEP